MYDMMVSCWGLDGKRMSVYACFGITRMPRTLDRIMTEEVLPEIFVDKYRGRVVGVEFARPDAVTHKDMVRLSRKIGISSLAEFDVATMPITCHIHLSPATKVRQRMLKGGKSKTCKYCLGSGWIVVGENHKGRCPECINGDNHGACRSL